MSKLVIHYLNKVEDEEVLCGQKDWQMGDPYIWIVNCKKCLKKLGSKSHE